MLNASVLLLLILAAAVWFPTNCTTKEFYVTPTPPPNPACPAGKHCETLDMYAVSIQRYTSLSERVDFLFLNGTHKTFKLEISYVHSLSLYSACNDSYMPKISIRLATLRSMQTVTIGNIHFYSGSLHVFNVCSTTVHNVLYELHQFTSNSMQISIRESRFINSSNYTASVYNIESVYYYNCSMHRHITVKIMDTVILEYGFIKLYTSTVREHRLSIIKSVINGSGLKVYASLLTESFLEISDCLFTSQTTMLFGPESKGKFSVSVSKTVFHQGQVIIVASTAVVTLWFVSFLGSDVVETSLSLYGPMNVTLDSCRFDNNKVILSTLRVDMVDITFIGNTTFSNNIGSNGGAIFLSRSLIWLRNGAQVNFINNIASQVGGAISIGEKVNAGHILLRQKCFYQFYLTEVFSDTPQVALIFQNNSANIGGDNIYGHGLKVDCTVDTLPDPQESWQLERMFVFKTPSLSQVSSRPKRICLCSSGLPQCRSTYFTHFNVYATPGETFILSAVAVGEDFGTVRGGVHASSITNEETKFTFGPGQISQQLTTNKQCSTLEYTIQPTVNGIREAVFMLSPDSISAASQRASLENEYSSQTFCKDTSYINPRCLTAPVIVTVHLLLCEIGFSIPCTTADHYICQCENHLLQYVHDCVTVNGTGKHYRNGTVWIGCEKGNQSETILAHSYCPFDYCKPESIGIDLHHPDEQCALNHSGVLCGGCLPGFSLAIGSSQCISCPNNNRSALFLAFIVAGALLILFIKVFDLTVAHGSINALIFYANAIWIYTGIFFQSGLTDVNSQFMSYYLFLKAFIAWLNLDFGIKTCFIQNLDAYWKTWLQFVFPFYIWILAGLIVAACHYSTRATRLFGNNAVPVLATVFMLTYSKLLRTITLALGPAVLQQYHPEGKRWVWLVDGNVPYLGVQHAFLFIMALLVLFLLWLPYTLILLFIQPIKMLPCACLLRLVVKFKPLLDTYTGPFKNKHQYWIGLTLLVRVFLAVTAVAFQAINPIVSINILLLVSILLSFGAIYVYKSRFNTFLELFFLFNLVLLCMGYMSTNVINSRMICTCVSICLSFMAFAGTLLYHIFLRLRRYFPARRINTTQSNELSELSDVPNIPTSKQVATTSVVDLRQLLIESENEILN